MQEQICSPIRAPKNNFKDDCIATGTLHNKSETKDEKPEEIDWGQPAANSIQTTSEFDWGTPVTFAKNDEPLSLDFSDDDANESDDEKGNSNPGKPVSFEVNGAPLTSGE